MPKEIKRRYAINFDLKIEQLREFYSASNPKGAYSKIRSYMQKHGFTHRQWSGYISDNTMTISEEDEIYAKEILKQISYYSLIGRANYA